MTGWFLTKTDNLKGWSIRTIENVNQIKASDFSTGSSVVVQSKLDLDSNIMNNTLTETRRRLDLLKSSFHFLSGPVASFVQHAIDDIPAENICIEDPKFEKLLALVYTFMDDIVDHARAFHYLDAGYSKGNFDSWDPRDASSSSGSVSRYYYPDPENYCKNPKAVKSRHSIKSLQEDLHILEAFVSHLLDTQESKLPYQVQQMVYAFS
jgi:hypothetical protein